MLVPPDLGADSAGRKSGDWPSGVWGDWAGVKTE